MISADQLTSMRATVLLSLPDTCTIRGAPGAPVFDSNTGTYTDSPGAVVYTGPCRVRPVPAQRRIVQFGEEPVSLRHYDATLPWSATGVEVDHVVTVTESSDPGLIGRPLRVIDVAYGSWDVHRRLVLEDNLQ